MVPVVLVFTSHAVSPSFFTSPFLFISVVYFFLTSVSWVKHVSSLLQPFVFIDQTLSSPCLSLSATKPSKPVPLRPLAPQTPRYCLPWAVSIMKAWFQYFPSFLCSLHCRLMQIPNFNKQLLNMSLTLLRLQMKLCYWDYSGSYSFVMSFVNHSWPAVYRMKLRLSSFFLRLLSFFHKELLFYSPKDWLLAQIRESETLIQNSQAFLYLKPATPSTFPPGNYIRIVYTRNCHLIIMKLVLSWQKWA